MRCGRGVVKNDRAAFQHTERGTPGLSENSVNHQICPGLVAGGPAECGQSRGGKNAGEAANEGDVPAVTVNCGEVDLLA